MIGGRCCPGQPTGPRRLPSRDSRKHGRPPAGTRTRPPGRPRWIRRNAAATTGGAVANAPSWDTAAAAWQRFAGKLSPAEPMPRTPIYCDAAKPSRPCRTTPTSDPAGTDGRACDPPQFHPKRTRGQPARDTTRRPFLPLPLVLKRPDSEVSRRVPALSRLKYANGKHETPYSCGFPGIVPVVPVVPAQNSKGRKKSTATGGA